jgi:purine-cytosine permease-like protein
MGWWPSRICVLLNTVIMLGYGLIDTLMAGQFLSSISGGSMSVIVGVIICSFILLVIVILGIDVFCLRTLRFQTAIAYAIRAQFTQQKKHSFSDDWASYVSGTLLEAGSDTTASIFLSFAVAMINFPGVQKKGALPSPT